MVLQVRKSTVIWTCKTSSCRFTNKTNERTNHILQENVADYSNGCVKFNVYVWNKIDTIINSHCNTIKKDRPTDKNLHMFYIILQYYNINMIRKRRKTLVLGTLITYKLHLWWKSTLATMPNQLLLIVLLTISDCMLYVAKI